ncbi:membrane protein insertion efficiency factor YidD [Nostoc punctiforme]|jgi:putative component of membrane protein insertase Oxa1/YidC/SpoIIIJ protein YidD|uniref:membrane protein insertion efficiency factor YidD n=1 Tax=Nostoc TaxID=1177 RepID=UPI00168A3B86|nr:membrane protein insertion efficiency factor YidD [Desmonostoc muscorum FACHB-395]
MNIISFEPLAKTMAIESITAYQKYISPSKGFSCSHRLLHGGDSCSNYVKRMLSEQKLHEAVQSSIKRFQGCGAASKTLKAKANFRCIVIPCCLPL